MNILVATLPDLRKINPQRPHHLLHYLIRKHQVTVLSVNAWWLEPRSDEFNELLLEDIEHYYLSETPQNPFIQEISARKKVASLDLALKDFDVVVSFHSLIAGPLLAKGGDLPIVIDVCDGIVDWILDSLQIPSFCKPTGEAIGSFIFKRILNRADRVTYSIESLIEKYQFPGNKTALISNGVDTRRFRRIESDKIRTDLQIPDDTFLIGFVGYLGEWTNLDVAFAAIKGLEGNMDVSMLVVGHGPKYEYYRNLAEHLRISRKVCFVGNIQYAEVPRYISSMDICLLPFDDSAVALNSLPLKLFEYMACEKPVISTHIPGVKRAAGDLPLYFTTSKDLENRLLVFQENRELIKQLGEVGRTLVEMNYSWDSIGSIFEKVLLESIENGR